MTVNERGTEVAAWGTTYAGPAISKLAAEIYAPAPPTPFAEQWTNRLDPRTWPGFVQKINQDTVYSTSAFPAGLTLAKGDIWTK